MLLYSTRGSWRNPTRDRGRVFGEAIVGSSPKRLHRPIKVAGREFEIGVDLEIQGLTSWGEGVDLSLLVPKLSMFPNKSAWSARLRNSLVDVPDVDRRLIVTRLRPLLHPPNDVLPDYKRAARLSG